MNYYAQRSYISMLEHAVTHNLPQHFAADILNHDRAWLAKHPREPFAWLLYECGSHLIPLSEAGWRDFSRASWNDQWSAKKAIRIVHDTFASGNYRWFAGDGAGTVYPVTDDEMLGFCGLGRDSA